MNCPNCHEGYIYGMRICIPCPICVGTGEFPEGTEYDPERGAALKSLRREAGLTLREWCKINHADAADRAHQERGYFNRKGDEDI